MKAEWVETWEKFAKEQLIEKFEVDSMQLKLVR